ncbi:UNVERIFIED_CONTAM: hypothetical protein PYX00_006738 [Menopon gallinae]|uniref:Uncharacterized protein n=1 Tax=Menopon gallinae TaxID=328185 RepID=A0AAW2HXI6_9NEOP
MAFNGSASMNKRPRLDIRNDVDNNHKMKADMNHGDEPRRKRPENPENSVLLYTIYNAVYPITTEVIHTISAPSGNVLRIVIFKKTGVQAMVEYPFIRICIHLYVSSFR